MTNNKLQRRLRTATILVVLGMAAQAATSLWNHPLAFLAFIFVASPIVVTGILFYLFALVRED